MATLATLAASYASAAAAASMASLAVSASARLGRAVGKASLRCRKVCGALMRTVCFCLRRGRGHDGPYCSHIYDQLHQQALSSTLLPLSLSQSAGGRGASVPGEPPTCMST